MLNQRSGSFHLQNRQRTAYGLRQFACLAFLAVLPVGAQIPSPGARMNLPPTLGQRTDGGLSDPWGSDPVEQEKRQRALNAARQKSLESDTEKLVKLAAAMKAEADAPGSTLSPQQQVNEWNQIERLAHSIKDRMSYVQPAASGFPQYGVSR